MIKLGAVYVACLCAGLEVLSGLGAVHPIGDSLAVFRGQLLFLTLVSGLLIASNRLRACFAVFSLLVALPLAIAMLKAGKPGEVVLYQKNLYFRNPDIGPLTEDLRASGAEVAMLQEVSAAHLTILLSRLGKEYPHWHWCEGGPVGGTLVLSKWPAKDNTRFCPQKGGASFMQVRAPWGDLWLVSVHLPWPWPMDQREQLRNLLPHLGDLQGPVLVAGDFNMVPWSYTLRQVTKATGTQIVGPVRPTLWVLNMPLPIDQVLASGGGALEIRPQLGSDHFGILARVHPIATALP